MKIKVIAVGFRSEMSEMDIRDVRFRITIDDNPFPSEDAPKISYQDAVMVAELLGKIEEIMLPPF